jgi:hypothetical protein
VPNIVLGLQGGQANGTESTFDGQPMQAGTHLRWSFAPELGFPPGGFWLCRRVATPSEQQIPLPSRLQAASFIHDSATVIVSPGLGPNEWYAQAYPYRDNMVIAGSAAEGSTRLSVKTFSRNSLGQFIETGDHSVAIQNHAFRIKIHGQRIAQIRVVGASNIEVDSAAASI